MSAPLSASSYHLFQLPNNIKIAVIGLGYIGLPLAVEFAKKIPVIGFDVKQSRLDELKQGYLKRR